MTYTTRPNTKEIVSIYYCDLCGCHSTELCNRHPNHSHIVKKMKELELKNL